MKPSVLVLIITYLLLLPTGGLFAQERFRGLTAEYYNGANFEDHVRTRVDKRLGFSRQLESPCPGVGKEYFSIRWSGALTAPTTGIYAFHVLADDGVRLWVNHELLIDAWQEQEATPYSASIYLEKGQAYDVRIEYFNTIIHSVLQIQWQIPEEMFSLAGLPVLSKETSISADYLTPGRAPKKEKTNLMVADVDKNIERRQLQADTLQKNDKLKEVIPSNARTAKPTLRRVKIESEEPIVLKSVIFEQQQSELLNDSYDELNDLIGYLKRNPEKKIEIRGHTDYVGDSIDNQQLSLKRATAVESYLVKNGVAKDRITTKGFGGTQPVVKKKDIEDRLVNRRVEFVLTD